MIKKTLLGLGVFLLSLISFSFSAKVGYIGESESSSFGNSYNILVSSKGNLSTQYNLESKKIFQIRDGAYFFWDNSGMPYMYVQWFNPESGTPGNIGQGYLQTYLLCDFIGMNTGNEISLQNCNKLDISEFQSFGTSFLSSLDAGYFYYDYVAVQYQLGSSMVFCLSSDNFSQSLCFYGSNGRNGSNGALAGGLKGVYGDKETNLSGSLGLSGDFLSISNSILGNSLGGTIPGGGGINNGNNNYLCPTVGQLLNTYSSEYNTGLCYSSSLIYSGNSVVSVSPQSIFELFENQSDFINYRQLYSNNCNLSPMSDNTTCNNIFEGKNLQYSLIAKIPGSVNSLNLYSYCNLALNQNPNTSTCVASGVYNTGVSRQDVINSINNGNYQIIAPNSGSVASDVLGTGMSYNGDILDTLQSLYSKFTSLFTTQSGNVVGILPTYIISMLLVIILFKLFKK